MNPTEYVTLQVFCIYLWCSKMESAAHHQFLFLLVLTQCQSSVLEFFYKLVK